MEEIKGESKIRKILFNEVTAAVALVGMVIGVMNWVQSPQQEITDQIKIVNHELQTHQQLQTQYENSINNQLETIRTGDLKDLKNDIIENRAEITKMSNEIIKLQTIINERIPKK